MTPVKFKPQNYFDSTLCEALDRIAREHDVVDIAFDPRGIKRREEPSKEKPWLFITNSRFDPERRAAQDGPNELSAWLRARPAIDGADAERQRAHEAWIEANLKALRAFEDAVESLVLALREGLILAKGFTRSGNRADVEENSIASGRWSMDWIIRREGNVAVCEFFTDISMQHAEHIITGVRLAAPASALPVESKPRSEDASDQNRKGGRRPIDDREAIKELFRIFSERKEKTLLAAVERLMDEKNVKVKGTDNLIVYERLRKKLKKIGRIVETPDGVEFVPNSLK